MTIFRSSQARPGFGDPEPSTVVGIVENVRHLSVADDPVPEVYVPYTREVWPAVSLLVRSRLDTRQLEPTLRRTVLTIEPELPVRGSGLWAGFRSLGGFVSAGLADRRSLTMMVASFAIAALALSALGLYGLVAYAVAQRRREFGIRLAVGATPRDVRALVVGQGMRLVVLGIAIGLAATAMLTRLFGALLFHTSPFDLRAFGASAGLLAAVALAGSWLPARRAARTDPVVALRDEG